MALLDDVPAFTFRIRNEMMDTFTDSQEVSHWLENLSDFAWVFDLQFRSVQADTRVAARMSINVRDILGRLAWESFSELTNTVWWEELRYAAEDKLPRRFEFFHPGWKLWLDCRIVMANEHMLVLATDTTSRKNLETALQDARQELESSFYSITHDMRAPLRAMQSFGRILQQEYNENLGPEGRDYLRRIVAASERLDRLIQDALACNQFSRLALPLSKIDLTELMGEILESYPAFQAPNATILVTEPLPMVRGNAAALTQCLANLIENGIKFSHPDKHPQIEIWAELRGSRVRIHIKDYGIGIDPAFHEKIFSMFYQQDPSYAGTGIGLVVVRKAAEKMNGGWAFIQNWEKAACFT